MEIYEPIKIYDQHGKYRFVSDRIAYLTKIVKNKTVLHVGCTDYPLTEDRLAMGSLLHEKIQNSASSIVGIDNSSEGIECLLKNGFKDVVLMDAEMLNFDTKFDVILAGDVLEHMNNPGKFLLEAKNFLNSSGELIVGLPNAYSFNIIKYLLCNFEPTHKDGDGPRRLDSLKG